MNRHLISIFAAGLLVVAAAASAQGPGFGPGAGMGLGRGNGPMGPGGPGAGMGPGNGQCLIDALGLTEEQQTAWQNLREQLHATLAPIREQRQALHEQIQAALSSGSPDSCAIGQLMVQVHALGEQGRAAREANQAAFVALLTPEQQAKYEVISELRGGCGAGPRGAGMHRGRAQGRRSSF